MRRPLPSTIPRPLSARLPRWLIQPLRILVFTGFLFSALFIATRPELNIIHVLLITIQVVFSLALLLECGNSAAAYRALDEAAMRAKKRQRKDLP